MNIALDFDNTFSADIDGWREVVAVLKARGHTVKIVTARTESGNPYSGPWESEAPCLSNWNDDLLVAIDGLDIGVIYCSYQKKSEACSSAGFAVDVWIDDDIEAI